MYAVLRRRFDGFIFLSKHRTQHRALEAVEQYAVRPMIVRYHGGMTGLRRQLDRLVPGVQLLSDPIEEFVKRKMAETDDGCVVLFDSRDHKE